MLRMRSISSFFDLSDGNDHHVKTLSMQFKVLLEQHGADDARDRSRFGEDLDNVGAQSTYLFRLAIGLVLCNLARC